MKKAKGKYAIIEFFRKLKTKAINFCKWIWNECKDWHTLVLLMLCIAITFGIKKIIEKVTGRKKQKLQ